MLGKQRKRKNESLSQLSSVTKILKLIEIEAIRRIFYMACEYLTKGDNCGALFNVKISDGVAHFCYADYMNCPRYQFVQQKK